MYLQYFLDIITNISYANRWRFLFDRENLLLDSIWSTIIYTLKFTLMNKTRAVFQIQIACQIL